MPIGYKHGLDKTPIVGKNWKLTFSISEATGGNTHPNFTCASAVLWNIDFVRNSDGYSCYGHIGATPVPKDEREELYAALVERFKDNTYMVQMVAVVNGGTAARAKHYLQSENKLNYHTSDFANYLIEKKVGVVLESPIFLNTYHKWDGPSICQSYHWFSPSICVEGALLKHTGGIHGLENVDKWMHESGTEAFKKNVGTFDGLVNGSLAVAERFEEARTLWNSGAEAPTISAAAKRVWKKVS